MAPTLRLVLAVVASLPESSTVRHDARLFVGAHYRQGRKGGGGGSTTMQLLVPCVDASHFMPHMLMPHTSCHTC